jgi:Uma2 family endonuclease
MIATFPKKESLLLDVHHTVLRATPEQFERLCLQNPDLRLELTKDGELIVMAPAGGETSERNADLTSQVYNWNKRTQKGRVFDSSGGYDLTAIDGGMLSPDVSWIEKSRLEGISIVKFISIVPDFVIELRSDSDRLKDIRKKMLEYQRLGVRLGLLVNPKKCQVEIYRLGKPTELLNSPQSIDCGEVMPGFTLNLLEAGIWPDPVPAVKQSTDTEEPIEMVILLRQLQRKTGELSAENRSMVRDLEPEILLELGDALLDFGNQQDLEKWLAQHLR